MNTPLELAADPQTSADVLYQLAAQYPEVRPVIAANPSAYPGLLEWLGQLGDAEVDMALAARAEWPVEETAGQPVEGDEEAAVPQEAVTEQGSEVDRAPDESEDLPGFSAAVAALEEEQADEALTAELDQAVQQVENGEALEAADPGTSPGRLQQLAAEFPHLRETILANPACYPELADWIVSKQPGQAEAVEYEDVAETTQIDAITEDLSATVVAATAVSLPVPAPPLAQTPPPQVTDPGPSTRGLWTAFTILGVLAVASVTVALILIFQ